MTKTLVDSITNWLNEGGYPLELYVAKTLKELHFFCSKSPFFTDAELEKPREIDLVAEVHAANERKQYLLFKLIIECKKSSHAFVILCDDSKERTILKTAIFDNLWTHSRDDMFVAAPFLSAWDKGLPKDFQTPLLYTHTRCGYTIVQANQKGDSIIYSEVYKLAKAHFYEIEKDLKFRKKYLKKRDKQLRNEMKNTFYAHLPVLVIDAPLVEVYIDETGDTKIEEKEISCVEIRLPWKPKQEEGLVIVIVTKSRLTDFAREIASLTKEIVQRQPTKGKFVIVPQKAEA